MKAVQENGGQTLMWIMMTYICTISSVIFDGYIMYLWYHQLYHTLSQNHVYLKSWSSPQIDLIILFSPGINLRTTSSFPQPLLNTLAPQLLSLVPHTLTHCNTIYVHSMDLIIMCWISFFYLLSFWSPLHCNWICKRYLLLLLLFLNIFSFKINVLLFQILEDKQFNI